MGGTYAHWLDEEYGRIRGGVGGHEFISDRAATMRLYALFGHPIHISDQQLFDSSATRALFGDPGFVDFARDYSPVKLQRIPSSGAATSTGDSLLRDAFLRPTEEGWVSSSTVETRSVVAAAHLIHDGGLDLLRDRDALRDRIRRDGLTPESIAYLQDLREGILYLADREHRVVPVRTARRIRFDEVLTDLADHGSELQQADAAFAIDHLDRLLPPESRPYRAAVLAALSRDERARWSPDQRRVWEIVVGAYLEATRTNLGLGASAHSSPVDGLDSQVGGLVSDTLHRVTGPSSTSGEPASRNVRIPVDLASLGWEEIRRARDLTSDSYDALERERDRGDPHAVGAAIEEHANRLAEHLTPRRAVSDRVWNVVEGGQVVAGGVVSVWFGSYEPVVASLASAYVVTKPAVEHALGWRRGRRVAEFARSLGARGGALEET